MTRLARPLLGVVAVAALATLSLAGCAAPEAQPTGAPSSESSETSTPTATASAASKARVVIGGETLSVLDEAGEPTLELQYSSTPSDAIGLLTDALGAAPTTAVVTDDPCNPQLDEASWGGLHLWSSVEGVNKPQDAQFYVTVDTATTGDLPIETPAGSTVGDSEQDVRQTNIDAPSFDDGADLHYDIVTGDASSPPDQYYGAAATITKGKLSELRSPIYYYFEC